MSIESAKAFIQRMKTDEEFAKNIMAKKTVESRMLVARDEGFNFTAEEISKISGELTDDQLDLVAGGEHNPFDDIIWTFSHPTLSGDLPLLKS